MLKKAKNDNSVLFIDASAEFTRGGNKNKLTKNHQQTFLNAFTTRKDIEHFAKLVSNEDIGANAYNIAVTSLIEAEDTREVIDVPRLNAKISQIVARQQELRNSTDATVADLEATK